MWVFFKVCVGVCGIGGRGVLGFGLGWVTETNRSHPGTASQSRCIYLIPWTDVCLKGGGGGGGEPDWSRMSVIDGQFCCYEHPWIGGPG